jgi:hypothetical protein
MSAPSTNSGPASRVILLPGDRFVVRRIELAAGSPAAEQAALALEALSPFPLAQLYHGHVAAPDGRHAVVFAAYRRNFSTEETAAWLEAEAVLPDFAAWLAGATEPRNGAVLHRQPGQLTLLSWDNQSALPAAITSRRVVDGDQAAARALLPAAEGARESEGLVAVALAPKGGPALAAAGRTAALDRAFLQSADVRDKDLFAAQRRAARRGQWMWRIFAGAGLGLAACALLDAGVAGGRAWLGARQRALAAQAPAVEAVQSAQALAAKLEDMASQQLRPFEMLARVNAARPASVEFTYVTTNGLRQLSVRAQTGNAGDVPAFDTALRALPAVDRVQLGGQRERDGLTTFEVEVTFKPGWLKKEGGA